jgi:hypothetical protein
MSTFINSIHLSVDGFSSMVFEHLRNLFNSRYYINGFSQLFMVCVYVVVRHIFEHIAKALGVVKLSTFIFQVFHHLFSQLNFVGLVV